MYLTIKEQSLFVIFNFHYWDQLVILTINAQNPDSAALEVEIILDYTQTVLSTKNI